MAEQRQAFAEGAKTQNGVAEKLAHAIFDQMNAFAGYGFVKSHDCLCACCLSNRMVKSQLSR